MEHWLVMDITSTGILLGFLAVFGFLIGLMRS